jgi:CRP/FNR family cyclic AMP-dependent transcriptional regulator
MTLSIIEFEPGDTIFSEGEDENVAYRILLGHVKIFTEFGLDTPHIIAQLGAGAIFGEMAMVEERPRSASAEATSAVRVERIDRKHFFDLLATEPAKAETFLSALFERLRRTNSRVLQVEMELRQLKNSQTSNLKEGHSQPSEQPAAVSKPIQVEPAAVKTKTHGLPCTIQAVSNKSIEMLDPEAYLIQTVPFRVGRKSSRTTNVSETNDLYLNDNKPYIASRAHFEIALQNEQLTFIDCGSKLGAEVNGERIGGSQSRKTSLELAPGDNEIYLGSKKMDVKFIVKIS